MVLAKSKEILIGISNLSFDSETVSELAIKFSLDFASVREGLHKVEPTLLSLVGYRL